MAAAPAGASSWWSSTSMTSAPCSAPSCPVASVVVTTTPGDDESDGSIVSTVSVAPRDRGAPRSPCWPRTASSSDWAISFGFSSAVASDVAANTDTATRQAPTPAMTRRGAGSRAACSRRHQRPNVPRRIGVSMIRKDISVTTAVIASAATNSATDSGRPDTSAHRLVDRPVVQVQPVRTDADPQQHGAAQQRTGQRSAMGHRGDHQQRRQVGDQEATLEQPRVGSVRRDDVQPPAQRPQPDQPDQRRRRPAAGPCRAAGCGRWRRGATPWRRRSRAAARSAGSASTGTRSPSSRCTAHRPPSRQRVSPRSSRSDRRRTATR